MYTVHEPNQRQKVGLFASYFIMFKNIASSRFLIWQLFKRDFLAGYKKSLLGLGWIFISPIVGIISWVIMNRAGILDPGELSIPYPAYVLLGSTLWGLFMGFYSSAAGTLSAGQSFIMQVHYPHEVLLVKQIAQQLSNFVITFILNIVVLLIFGVTPDLAIFAFPVIVLPLFFLGAGLGLIASVISVVANDLTHFLGMALGFIFYITPIVYTSKIDDPVLSRAVDLNPLTYAVGGVRDVIINGQIEYPDRFLAVGLVSLLFFLLAWRLFYVSEYKVIEKMI